MNNGKKICNQLKDIRRDIAKQNGIALDIPECTYQGECSGSCPRCDAELQYLEREITNRSKLGKVAAMAGMAVGLTAGGQAVTAQDIKDQLRGDVPNVIRIFDSCLVVGTLHDINNGDAIVRAVVSLFKDGKEVISVLTNENGYFELKAVDGEYQLRYMHPEYEEQTITVTLNQNRLDMGNTELSRPITPPPLMGIVPYDPKEHQQEEN